MTSTTQTAPGSPLAAETLWRAYLALGAGIVSISFSAIFVRWANAPGAVTGFYRMLIAVIVLAFPFMRYVHRTGRLPRREVMIALAAGLFFGGDLVFWNTGILISGSGHSHAHGQYGSRFGSASAP